LITLLWRVRPRSRSGSCDSCPRRDLDGAADEALGALARAALNDLDQALEPRDLLGVRHEALDQ